MLHKLKLLLPAAAILVLCSCSAIQTNDEFYKPVIQDLQNAKYADAEVKIQQAENAGEYNDKDRLLMLLDKGMTEHYNGEYEKSNRSFSQAEQLMEELYTKSISKGVGSFILNDNVLDYSGEVYENLYINIFKSLNYLHLNDFDGAYVEANRISNKLKYYKTMYEEMTSDLNNDKDNKIKVDSRDLEYLNSVLANYIGFIIYRAEGEYDNSRISRDQLMAAWNSYPDVYNFHIPDAVADATPEKGPLLNILAFTGIAPGKEAVGARITTLNDALIVSDPTKYYANAIFFPGIKYGYNFKFEFPQMVESKTAVNKIIVEANGEKVGNLQLLEDMNSVAVKTFQTNKSIIFFKTIARAVAKGISAGAIGKELQKKNEGFLGDLLTAITNAAFDATEHADLRSWKTMPGYCYAGEFKLDPGEYNLQISYYDRAGQLIQKDTYNNFKIVDGMNFIESFCLL